MRRVFFVWVLIAGVAWSVACGKSYSSATDIDAGVDTGVVDAAPPACPAGCFAATPAGWTGPSEVYQGAPDSGPTACPLSYPARDPDSFVADAAATTCACGDTKQNDPMFNYRVYNAGQCPGPAYVAMNVLFPGPCVSLMGGNALKQLDIFSTFGVDCCSPPSQDPVPPLDETVITSCSERTPAACNGRPDCNAALTPDAPFTRVCIHADGDLPCPNADFPDRFVSYQNVSDTRSCTPCTADLTEGPCARVALFADDSCGSEPSDAAVPVDGGCVDIDGFSALRLTQGSGSCAVDGGGLTGSIALNAPVTYCCAN